MMSRTFFQLSKRGRRSAWLVIGIVFLLSSCSTGPELDLIIHDSPKGAVYLERMSDRSFEATHPITLSPDTIAKVLRGVMVRSEQGILKGLIAGAVDTARAFSDDDVTYLAPLIADGLSKAASDQQVGFRVSQIGTGGYSQSTGAGVGSSEPPLNLTSPERTSGAIFAYGRSLYVMLSQYRHRPEPPNTISMANRRIPDPTGLANRTVLFVPEAAKRPESYRPAHSAETTLVIDYELLGTLSPASTSGVSSRPASSADRAVTAQPPSGKRESIDRDEIEALRKELEDIKRQLAEQNAQRGPSPPKKPVAP